MLMASLASCLNGGEEGDGIKNYVTVGSTVPSFSVTKADGNTEEFQASRFVGKRSVVVLFRSSCGDCQRELPKVYSAWEELQDEVDFICVSRAENADAVALYWNRFASMPYYLDPDAVAFNKFANSYVPRIYLVGTDGKVKHFEIETFSFANGAELVELINEKI